MSRRAVELALGKGAITPGAAGRIAAVVATFVRVIETNDFEPRLQEFDDRLKALDAARATGAGSIWDHNRRV